MNGFLAERIKQRKLYRSSLRAYVKQPEIVKLCHYVWRSTSMVRAMKQQARVMWKSLNTGAIGHGSWLPAQQAIDAVKYANSRYSGIIHWVENR